MNRPLGTSGLPPEPVVAGRTDPIAEHVRAALDARLRTLLEHEPGARGGEEPEQLHQVRVSVRRMRSVLKSAAPFLDQHWSEPLRAELGWFGRELGEVRDLDVLVGRLRGEAADFEAAQRESAARLIGPLELEHRAARESLVVALDGERHRALINALVEAVHRPLPASGVEHCGPRELRALVAKQYRRLRRTVDEIGTDPTNAELHALRILGKRLRYTAELAEPVLGKPMRQLLSAAKRFQDVLGEHQDACVAERRVLELLAARGPGPDPAIAFVAGRLVERERSRRLAHREQWHESWRELRGTAAKV
ncbi:CHAD domain-containing protein [Saccharopolyspora sp. NFXS83]|uniref:CHAD domain-containing protein n=1 Tax=Saccharopolyspora sp. NFXS83 TaxID=2993560 RepID=UPI00224AE1B2|nr:CHAD domain-containing protein [Saccharopolyspora sp. NFXS83]MCX2733256.1 CHAD domain-containing protein [Saccharopolyspora sp. NFXS83]